MKICTEVVETEVALVERPDDPRPHSPGLPATAEAYWRSLKWHLDNCRGKLAARVRKLKEVRRAAKQDVGALEAEVARQAKLLRKAGVEPGEPSPLESLRKEVARLNKALSGALPSKEAARANPPPSSATPRRAPRPPPRANARARTASASTPLRLWTSRGNEAVGHPPSRPTKLPPEQLPCKSSYRHHYHMPNLVTSPARESLRLSGRKKAYRHPATERLPPAGPTRARLHTRGFE